MDLTQYVLAAGALGTSAFAVVDASKAAWGGVSNCGFGQITRVVGIFIALDGEPTENAASPRDILRANWLNGMALGDQKAVAKSLIKLHLNDDNAATYAKATRVDAEGLENVARKIATGESLTSEEANIFGRFDLMLTTLLDEGFQRADQIYRNSARVWALAASVVIAFFAWWGALEGWQTASLGTKEMYTALFTGLIATPIAPVAKDLASVKAIGLTRT
jgi:hypothetical protein